MGRLKKFLSAWVAFDAIFRADSENRIKKIIKNGLGGGESPLKIQILGVKMPFFGPPEKGASNVLFSISDYVNPRI